MGFGISLLALGLLGLGDAELEQAIELRILILHVARARRVLDRDLLRVAARRIVGVHADRRLRGDEERVELALRRVLAPHDRGGHVLDLPCDADLLPVLLEERLAALARPAAGGRRQGGLPPYAVPCAKAVRAHPAARPRARPRRPIRDWPL